MRITEDMISAVSTTFYRTTSGRVDMAAAEKIIAAVAPLILEEAAKVADAEAAEQDELDLEGTMRAETAGHIADRIRSLSPTSHTSPEE